MVSVDVGAGLPANGLDTYSDFVRRQAGSYECGKCFRS